MAQAEGDLLAARALLERELDLYPRSPGALRALYVLYATQGEWKAEIEVVERLLMQEETPVLWHAKAQAQFNLEDFGASRQTLDVAMERYPDASLLILLDANLLAKEGEQERAEARFEEAKRAREREEGLAPSP
jgi:tetratricopeptide (TPR) repeat protein